MRIQRDCSRQEEQPTVEASVAEVGLTKKVWVAVKDTRRGQQATRRK